MTAENSSPERAILVLGARTHNLKNIDCRIPHGRVTVVTGLSGAGKSSLAFDTIYAEAQRRFVESMSTYARQFLDKMERPPIEAMENILPAVALEARTSIKNARSTVGTITEVHDVLRLLFTHLGQVYCPEDPAHGVVRGFAIEEMVDDLAAGHAGERFYILARPRRPKTAKTANAKLQELVRQGYARILGEDGEIVRLDSKSRWTKKLDPLPLVLGRFSAAKAGGDGSARLASTLEEALQLGGGRVEARADDDSAARFYGRRLICACCGATVPKPTPPLFSFNSPLGACPTCQGFGRTVGIDPQRVIPDPKRTLEEQPIAPWNSPAYEELYGKLFRACGLRGVPLDVPWEELPWEDRTWIWTAREKGWTSIDSFFGWLERRNYKMHVRVLLSRYRAYNECKDCGGERLRPESLGVLLHGENVSAICARTLEQLRAWLAEQTWTSGEQARAGHLLEQLQERVETLYRVGLGYLTLDRQARTLSGGESQRIQLATALGSGLTSTLYVLDEPTVGLHPRDSERLLELLRDLARRGNTVLVVEHDRTLIGGADHIIDLGPLAGEHGGEVLAEGTLADILASKRSRTAEYLRERAPNPARLHGERYRREKGLKSHAEEVAGRPKIRIRGAREHNLRGFDVDIPLRSLVAVTGVSGSGKSTLVENVLHGTYQRGRGVVDVEPGVCDALEGIGRLTDITLVDQRPLGRSARSNPVTYVKAYDEIRKLFAATEEARRRKIQPGHFSFNVDRGRCPECKGTGTLEVDMQFMASVTVACDTCQGHRFKPEVLAITLKGRNIAETLELTVDAAIEIFEGEKRLLRRLGALVDVGLGYLRLGQATSTLSGGEAQRLKLASFLDRPKTEERLFLFDEPTTGLHLADIDLLHRTLRRLVQEKNGVLVVEHNLDLIEHADWIIDLGPGGGSAGGELLFSGPLETFLDTAQSPTAEELRAHMKWPRKG